MFFFNYADLLTRNLASTVLELFVPLTYFFDVLLSKNLLLMVYIDLISDVSELFVILILISILLNAIFILLIYVHQLLINGFINPSLYLSQILHNNLVKSFKYSDYINMIVSFRFKIFFLKTTL